VETSIAARSRTARGKRLIYLFYRGLRRRIEEDTEPGVPLLSP
jgi:hypothetical protein